MTWEHRLLDLFEDLEQQAEGLSRTELEAEVAELAVAEYAEIDLASRVHASVGGQVELTLAGGGVVRGRLARAGAGWCLLHTSTAPPRAHLVRLRAVAAARGLSPRAVPASSRRVAARLGLGSVLRSLSEEQQPVLVIGVDGGHRHGAVGRVGADFFELLGDTGCWLLPFAGVAALQC